MQGKEPRNKIILLSTLYLLLATFLTGCATVPQSGSFGQKAKSYVPVLNLCQQYGFDWQWDSFVRIVTLKKENNEIKLLVGSPLILINGLTKKMSLSAELYRGMVIVPVEFKELIKDF